MITLQYTDGGVSRSLDLMIDSARDLPGIFKKYVQWLRPEILEVFDAQGPGWSPLSDASTEHRAQNLSAVSSKIRSGQTAGVGRRLAREQARAVKRLAKQEGPVLGARMQKLRDSVARSVARQEVIRGEFERITSGAAGPARKEAKKLGERLGRASERAESKIKKYESGDLLGQIASSITYEIKGGNLEVFSRIPWAGAHNDGATVGHGARVPERKFLEWTAERIAKLAEIAAETIAEKAKR